MTYKVGYLSRNLLNTLPGEVSVRLSDDAPYNLRVSCSESEDLVLEIVSSNRRDLESFFTRSDSEWTKERIEDGFDESGKQVADRGFCGDVCRRKLRSESEKTNLATEASTTQF